MGAELCVMLPLLAVLALAAPPPVPAWIAPGSVAAEATTATFTSTVTLPSKPDRGLMRLTVRDRCRVTINGRPCGVSDAVWAEVFEMGPWLRQGRNTISVETQADAVQGPANAWLVLSRALAEPVSADTLAIETSGARGGEWLYVEVLDADGVTSGYYCPERRRTDMLLGTSGERRVHTIRLREEERLDYGPSGSCAFDRIRTVRLRLDQKDTSRTPRGSIRIESVRLLGTSPRDLGGPGWSLLPGAGSIRRCALTTDGAALVASYDFGPAADRRVAFDLRAIRAGREVGRLVSGPDWQADGMPVKVVERPGANGWLYAEFAATDQRDLRERGRAPFDAVAVFDIADGADRVEAGKPFAVAVRFWTLGRTSSGARASLAIEDWSGRTVQRLSATATGQPDALTARFAVPRVGRGIYRLRAQLAGAKCMPDRFGALAALGPGEKRVSALFDTLRPFARPMRGLQGVDLAWEDSPALLVGLRDLGVNFLQFHIAPEQLDNGDLNEIVGLCKAVHVRFALNNETANWSPSAKRPDGTERFAAAGGCHRWDIEPSALRAAAASGLFVGVVYDEGEHMQMSRNAYSGLADRVRRKPYLVETTGMSLPEAHRAFVEATRRVSDYNRAHGGRMLVESVFPVLQHPLAAAGVTLVPKLLKEDVHPVVLAMALGAARQYGADLWFSPDLWRLDQMPGHSTREYAAALRLAERAGVERVYTEFVTCLVRWRGPQVERTPYGQVLRDHIVRLAAAPVSATARSYRDFAPEVAIVRFPDSDWGQASCSYWNTLYGALDLHSTPETREWLQVWNLITGGATHPAAVNANSGVYDRYRWQPDCPSPATVVYDHLVGYELLKGIGTLFLCGIAVSEPTLAAVRRCVREGAVCFAPPRFCPPEVRTRAASTGSAAGSAVRVRDGKGAWIVAPSFELRALGDLRRMLPGLSGRLDLRLAPPSDQRERGASLLR